MKEVPLGIEIVMSIVGIIQSLSGIPQIISLLKQKTSVEVSLLTWSIVFGGCCFWTLYGIYLFKISIMLYGISGVLVTGTIVFLTIKYRR